MKRMAAHLSFKLIIDENWIPIRTLASLRERLPILIRQTVNSWIRNKIYQSNCVFKYVIETIWRYNMPVWINIFA